MQQLQILQHLKSNNKIFIQCQCFQFNNQVLFIIFIQLFKQNLEAIVPRNYNINLKLQSINHMKNITILFLLTFILTQTNCLFLPVTSRPLCINIEQKQDKQTHFFYQVTGNNPQNMKVDFQPQGGSNTLPFHLTGQSGQTKFTLSNVKVCFISTDGGYKSISLDFYSQDVAHLAQLAKKSDLYQLHTKLISVGEKIKQVNRNQIFQQQRQSIHGKIIQQHQSKLKILVIFKLAAIIIVAAAQLYLLKTMLSKTSQGYQPV